jgi:hypothetical protein
MNIAGWPRLLARLLLTLRDMKVSRDVIYD